MGSCVAPNLAGGLLVGQHTRTGHGQTEVVQQGLYLTGNSCWVPNLVERLSAEPGLVDVNRVASYFSVDPETVRRWVRIIRSQLAAGQHSVTASYPGDTNYTASTSLAVSLNLVADFSINNRGITSQTVTAGTSDCLQHKSQLLCSRERAGNRDNRDYYHGAKCSDVDT